METKQVWVKRPEEWIKQNPGKPTMYKTTVTEKETPPELIKQLTNESRRVYAKKDKGADIGIYAIICEPSKRAYIGQSINVQTRLRNHKMNIKTNQMKCYAEMRKDIETHGIECFEFIRIKHCINGEDLTEEENNSMGEYISKGYKLYNTAITANNLFVNPEHKELFFKLNQLINSNPDIINKLQALID